MTESTVGWFGVREAYCSLADKPRLISQIRPSEQAPFGSQDFHEKIKGNKNGGKDRWQSVWNRGNSKLFP